MARLWCLFTLQTLGCEDIHPLESLPLDAIDWRVMSELVHSNWHERKGIQALKNLRKADGSKYHTYDDGALLSSPEHFLFGHNGTRVRYECPDFPLGSRVVLEDMTQRSIKRLCQQIMSIADAITIKQIEPMVECSGSLRKKPVLFVPTLLETLELPIQPAKLRALIDGGLCEEAPLGRGSETIVDLSARKCWRMQLGKDVTQLDPGFQKALLISSYDDLSESPLNKIKEKLLPHLCDRGEVHAQPYQLLIYEEGGMFKPHRDTLRGEGNFGSCVVTLPVAGEAEGGELVLEHESGLQAGVEPVRVVHHPPAANEKPKWQAFFTDVVHEVKPVTKGYRVALTYHLWTTVPPAPAPSRLEDKAAANLAKLLGLAVDHWLLINRMRTYVRFLLALDHDYSSFFLTRANLRGRDRLWFGLLDDAFAGTNIGVSLSTIEMKAFDKPEKGEDCIDFGIEMVETDREILVECSHQDVWINKDRVLQMNHERLAYEYDTGNEGYTNGWKYEHACVVLEHEEFTSRRHRV